MEITKIDRVGIVKGTSWIAMTLLQRSRLGGTMLHCGSLLNLAPLVLLVSPSHAWGSGDSIHEVVDQIEDKCAMQITVLVQPKMGTNELR